MMIVQIVAAFALILIGAELFTNGIEWLGVKLNLSEGATGSILAAIGTAMPETMIPVIAILFTPGDLGDEIGIGAILGAPFMLGTVVLPLMGITAYLLRARRGRDTLRIDRPHAARDLQFFLVAYSIALILALLPPSLAFLKRPAGLVFLPMYCFYLYLVLRPHKVQTTSLDPETLEEELEETPGLEHLTLAEYLNRFMRTSFDAPPPLWLVLVQVLGSFGLLVAGAQLFSSFVGEVSAIYHLPALLVALILAPLATELPEAMNSLIWVKDSKDPIALGNVAGAMVFQSMIPVMIGVVFTPWQLNSAGLFSAAFALIGGLIVYLQLKLRATSDAMPLSSLVAGGAFYFVFVILVFAGHVQA